MCASPLRGAAGPVRHGKRALRLSAFRLRSFSFVLTRSSSVLKRRFANASTGICLLQLRMEHRIKSVMTI
jgi:hypothetical protein